MNKMCQNRFYTAHESESINTKCKTSPPNNVPNLLEKQKNLLFLKLSINGEKGEIGVIENLFQQKIQRIKGRK